MVTTDNRAPATPIFAGANSCVLFGHFPPKGPRCVHCDAPVSPPPGSPIRPGVVLRTRGRRTKADLD